jgi:hypothetical protein
VVGCHKKYQCHGADCARFGFKNCAAHSLDTPPVVEAPIDTRTPEQKIADAASYAEMEKRNLQLLDGQETHVLPGAPWTEPVVPAPPAEP